MTAVACDVTDEASPQLLVDTAIECYGRLDILISNAGIIQVGPVQAGQAGLNEEALDIMALAPVRFALTALPVMPRQIISAVRGRRAEIILTPAAQLVSRVAGLAPGLTSEVLHVVQRLALPAPPSRPAREGDEPVPGHELNPALPRKAFDRLTTLGRAAAARFNERPQ